MEEKNSGEKSGKEEKNEIEKEKGYKIDPSWQGVIKWGGLSLFVGGAIALIFFFGVIASGLTLPVPAKDMLEEPFVPSALFTLCIIGEILLLPSVLGLYFALKDVKKTPMFIATAIWALCVPMFIASRGLILAISQISGNYLDTTDAAMKASYLASAELALETQNLYAMMGLILLSVASVIIGVVMLKDKEVFGAKIGYVVIVAGIFTFFGATTVIVEAVPIVVPVLGVILSAIWQFYIGFKMYKMSKDA